MTFDTAPQQEDEPTLNITPMVDMVFNLLAFFVLTTSFIVERNMAVGSERPNKPRPAPAPATGDLPERVVIRLTPRQDLSTVGITVGRTSLPDNGFAQVSGKLAEINLPRIPVVIACDRKVGIEPLSQVITAVMASPMKRLALSELSVGGAEALRSPGP